VAQAAGAAAAGDVAGVVPGADGADEVTVTVLDGAFGWLPGEDEVAEAQPAATTETAAAAAASQAAFTG
jgi:hypothetical protein